MNRIVFALSVLAIVGIAAWAYHVNYRTNTVLREIDRLNAEIAERREDLQVLRVEWAYLNSPERLQRLVMEHEKDLALVPISPDRFGQVAAVPFPPLDEEDALTAALTAAAASGAFIPPQPNLKDAVPAPVAPVNYNGAASGPPAIAPTVSARVDEPREAPTLVAANPLTPMPPRRPGG